jgi:hypothetical protein
MTNAIAPISTLLGLNRYARIMGIPPVQFNGGGQIQLSSGNILYPNQNNQLNAWPQFSWQDADKASRDELAREIFSSEQDISDYLKYNVAPDWVEGEFHSKPNDFRITVSNYYGDTRDNRLISNCYRERIIDGGKRNSVLVDNNISIAWWDIDTDGWKELATAILYVGDISPEDYKYLRFYHYGHGGEREWEIRYPKAYYMNGEDMTVHFDAWTLLDPELQCAIASLEGEATQINMLDADSYVTKIEAYLEINDTTENAIEFVGNINGKSTIINGGYMNIVEGKLSEVEPISGIYTGTEWSIGSYPDFEFMKFNYYSGYVDEYSYKFAFNDPLSPVLAQAIAYMATSRLERIFYGNNNVTALATSLREDLATREAGVGRYVTQEVSSCPFGTRRGEYKAFQIVKKMKKKGLGIAVI